MSVRAGRAVQQQVLAAIRSRLECHITFPVIIIKENCLLRFNVVVMFKVFEQNIGLSGFKFVDLSFSEYKSFLLAVG